MSTDRTKFMATFLILCALAMFAVVYVGLGYYMNGHLGSSYYDLHVHHAVRARAIGMSYDETPQPLITAPTVPWALILGQAYYAGFLSVRNAELLNLCLHVIVYMLSMLLLYKCLKDYLAVPQILTLCVLPAAHFSYAYSLWWGNEAGIICFLMVDAILIAHKHPYIAGVLISLCMCKPQIAGIICIMFLVRGHVKPVLIGAVICLAAWVGASVMTGRPMLQLLAECFSSGIDSPNDYYTGLFHVLTLHGFNKNAILAANVFTGLAYMMLLYNYLRKNIRSEVLTEFAAYVPACLASVVWMYKNGCDYLLLAYPAAVGVLLCMNARTSRKDFMKALICTGYLLASRCLVYFGIALISRTNEARALYKSFDGLLIMITGIILCRLLVKYQEE